LVWERRKNFSNYLTLERFFRIAEMFPRDRLRFWTSFHLKVLSLNKKSFEFCCKRIGCLGRVVLITQSQVFKSFWRA
jgi:hypothetical protein